MFLALELLYPQVESNWTANLRRLAMKKITSIFTATLIAGIILMNLQSVRAQEWRVLTDTYIFTGDPLTPSAEKGSGKENDWLATQTPLLRHTPITELNSNNPQLWAPRFEEEYSQLRSWSPLQSPPGQEHFTLFSF